MIALKLFLNILEVEVNTSELAASPRVPLALEIMTKIHDDAHGRRRVLKSKELICHKGNQRKESVPILPTNSTLMPSCVVFFPSRTRMMTWKWPLSYFAIRRAEQ
jgi:hypothetical protein